MRALHTADLHGGVTRYGTVTPSGGSTRLDDFQATLDRFVNAAKAEKVDLAIFAGDTFNTRREGPEERAAFSEALYRLQPIRCIVVPGNHDGMTTIGDPSTHALRWLHALRLPWVTVALHPLRAVLVHMGNSAVSLTAFPYPHKRAFDDVLTAEDPDDRVIQAGAILERTIADVASRMEASPSPWPRLFVGHLTVGGSTVGSETSMKFSWDVAIGPSVLDQWDYAALGHIHKQQAVPGTKKAWYPGSPEYLDFSEVAHPKGFLLVDFDRGTDPVVKVIPSGARPMIEMEIAMPDSGDYRLDRDWLPPGAIVRLVGRPAAGHTLLPRAIDALVRAVYERGASYVKVDITAAESTAPATRIEATSDLDVLTATERWLQAHDYPTEPAMTAARQLLAATIEGGTP